MLRERGRERAPTQRRDSVWWFWWAIWAGAVMTTVRGKGTLFWLSHTAKERQSRDWAQVKALVTEVMGQCSVASSELLPPAAAMFLGSSTALCSVALWFLAPSMSPLWLTILTSCLWRPDGVTLSSNMPWCDLGLVSNLSQPQFLICTTEE